MTASWPYPALWRHQSSTKKRKKIKIHIYIRNQTGTPGQVVGREISPSRVKLTSRILLIDNASKHNESRYIYFERNARPPPAPSLPSEIDLGAYFWNDFDMYGYLPTYLPYFTLLLLLLYDTVLTRRAVAVTVAHCRVMYVCMYVCMYRLQWCCQPAS